MIFASWGERVVHNLANLRSSHRLGKMLFQMLVHINRGQIRQRTNGCEGRQKGLGRK